MTLPSPDTPARDEDGRADPPDLEDRFLRLEQRRGLLAPGSRLLLAVSGGLDSAVLLHLLHRLAPRFPWSLAVAHVHHGIRTGASDDAAAVAGMAAERELPFLERRVGPRLERLRGGSLEARARAARYEALEEMRAEAGADAIVLAHTADDRVETLLFNLIRGTGPRGLGSLRERRGRRIRPLLPFRRVELLRYARRASLSWRTDPTNWSASHTRNWIRHTLVPLLEREGHPGAGRSLARAADLLSRWAEGVDRAADAVLPEAAGPEDQEIVLERSVLDGLDEWTWTEVIRRAHRRVAGGTGSLTSRHIEDLKLHLGPRAPGRSIDLPGAVEARISRTELRLGPAQATGAAGAAADPAPVTAAGARMLGMLLSARAVDPGEARSRIAARWNPANPAPSPAASEFFDAGGISGTIAARPWRSGDRIRPFGMRGSKLVSDLLTDASVTGGRRLRMLVVEDARGILWVPGVRRSDRAPVTPDSRAVLELTCAPVA